jgi:hypothetical protein
MRVRVVSAEDIIREEGDDSEPDRADGERSGSDKMRWKRSAESTTARQRLR